MQNEPATYTRIKASLEVAIEAFVTTSIAEIPRRMCFKGRISQVEGAQLRSILRACAKDMKRPFVTAEVWYDDSIKLTIPIKKNLEIITSWLLLVLPPTEGLDRDRIEKLPIYLAKPQTLGRLKYDKDGRALKDDNGDIIKAPGIASVYSFHIQERKIYDTWINRVKTDPSYQAALGNI